MSKTRSENLRTADVAIAELDSIVGDNQDLHDTIYKAKVAARRFLDAIDLDDVDQVTALRDLEDEAREVVASLEYQRKRLAALLDDIDEVRRSAR